MSKINVCLSCDDNYSKYAGVVIASTLSNATINDELTFYILDGGISEEKKQQILSLKYIKNCEIVFISIKGEEFETFKSVCTHKYITIPAYYRLKLASLLPDVEKIIYFDCDIIVNYSLKSLFNIDLGNYLIAGVRDINKKMLKKNPNYVNSGMLLFNLDLIRRENTEEQFLNYTKTNFATIKLGDQEIINNVCKNRIKIINDEWNIQSSNFTNRSSYSNNPKIIHFVAKNKPWHRTSFSYHKNLYFKYLQLTPWKLNKNELETALKSTALAYFKYRPLFLIRPRFYKALFYTYIKPLFEIKKPIIKNNTFIVWEPCSKSHSEVVPGYVKYLIDLGYHVSVIVNPNRLKEGLFSRFESEQVSLNQINKKQMLKYLKKSDLSDVEGILVTTVGKLCDEINFDNAYKIFNKNVNKSKIFFVSHEAKHALDNDSWREDNITLRKLNYKNGKSVVVNPHYFGNIKYEDKNDVTNFVMVGAIRPYKKNDNTIIEAVIDLHNKGITNFKITTIGKGHIKNIPQEIRKYFDIKGRLQFDKMYDELEKADFLLTAYDTDNPEHIRYNTTGTSGNFQLVYGFNLPCIITEEFAPINEFNDKNAILYTTPSTYSDAMKRAINMSEADYKLMQNALKETTERIYTDSLQNLRRLVND